MAASDAGPVIGYAGMTHLGLNSAVAAAERGFRTICFDDDSSRISDLNLGTLPVVEPGLSETFARNRIRLTFTSDATILAQCDVVYVAPDVATDDQGHSDLEPLATLIRRVDKAISPTTTMVILSQVPPGFTRRLAGSLIRQPGHLIYQVETLIFGRAIERALHPERIILGFDNPQNPIPTVLKTYLESFGCPILPMRYESAELAKISINCCLVASISVANTMAELCENIGADWSEITPALKLDRRIGQFAYLMPGLGISGGNLERDLSTVCQLADEHGSDAGVVRAWIANSRYRKDWALRVLHERVLKTTRRPTIAVLGLAYKEDTHSTKNSPSLALIENLQPFELAVFDPIVRASAAPHPRAREASSALDACYDADAVLIMTPWRQFRDLSASAIAKTMRGRVLIDPFRIIDRNAATTAGLEHVTLGLSD